MEGIRRESPNARIDPNIIDIYQEDEHLDDYIHPFFDFRLHADGSFRFYGFKVGTKNKTMAFRTLKNASRDYINNYLDINMGPQKYQWMQNHTLDKEGGGNTLSVESYNKIVNSAMGSFRSQAASHIRRGERMLFPDIIITPSSSSPHAADLGFKLKRIEETLHNGLNRSFMPGGLKKSTKAELYMDLFNKYPPITQQDINDMIRKYNDDLEYKSMIDDLFSKHFIKSSRIKKDIPPIISNVIQFLKNENIPTTKEISMADNIRIGVNGRAAHDSSMVGYFRHSDELINKLNNGGVKSIWIADDNMSTGSTIYAAEEFINGVNLNNKPKISWFFLLKALPS